MGPNNLRFKQAGVRWSVSNQVGVSTQLKHHSSDLSTHIQVRNKIYSSENKTLGKLLSITFKACFLQNTADRKITTLWKSMCFVQ